MIRRRAPLCALLLGAAACSTAEPAGTGGVPRPTAQVRHALPHGAVVRLLPVETTVSGTAPLIAIDGWWREAVRQSDVLDVAAGNEDVERLPDQPVWSVRLSCDPAAGSLATSLLLPEGAPLPLASAAYAEATLPAAIDELALKTRMALGDPCQSPALPIALAYSPDPRAVQRVEQALGQAADGKLREAKRILETARRLDGGSPVLLDVLATVQSVLGETAAARALADEALGYRHRLLPTTLHRLLRTQLMARASERPASAGERDQELLALGEVSLRERPFDVQGRLSKAMALNFLDRFQDSAPLWTALAARLPHNAMVQYHRGWAELALLHPADAAAAFEQAAPRLPQGASLLPRAIALYELGDHERLDRLLADAVAEPELVDSLAGHDLRRMQAAHAILEGHPDVATRLLLEALEWLRVRPSLLQQRAGEVAETSAVLVSLGQAEALAPRVTALQDLAISHAALQDALAYAQGLCVVARTGDRATAAEASLLRNGREDAWGYHLRALGHRAKGELRDEYADLTQAARWNDSPLIKAALVRCLREMGRTDEADELRTALRRELREIHLRRRLMHPLLAPELALAYRVP
jgi:tetratricopeptide (TPR) repeat protein